MTVCVYDNPSTMRREAWRDGKIDSSISADLLLSKDFKGGNWFDFRLNVGPWTRGVFHGDKEAMTTKE